MRQRQHPLVVLFLLFAALLNVVSGTEDSTSSLFSCEGKEECCDKNWDLQRLGQVECYSFCERIGNCNMKTGKAEYIQYLGDTNIINYGGLRAQGFTEEQRDCVRYWETRYREGWSRIKCCITKAETSCTKYTDNYAKGIKDDKKDDKP